MVKRLFKDLILRSGLFRIAGNWAREGVVILRYHSVCPDPGQNKNSIGCGITHPVDLFEMQMEFIRSNFDSVTMDDVLEFLNEGRKMPRRAVAVTFDDGFYDNFAIAEPILRKTGIRATFYITVEPVDDKGCPWFVRLRHAIYSTEVSSWTRGINGKTFHLTDEEGRSGALLQACRECAVLSGDRQADYLASIERDLEVDKLDSPEPVMMNWEQIRALRRGGHLIGSHSMTHPNMGYLEASDVAREMRESKNILEGRLGTPIVHFSYPSPMLEPHWTEVTREISMRCGYRTGVTCVSGLVKRSDNLMSLKRIFVPFSLSDFHWDIENTRFGRTV